MRKLIVIGPVLLMLLLAWTPGISFTEDLGRHLLLGQIISETHHVPDTNYLTYTHPDFPFVNHHWLSEVILYRLHNLIGLNALGNTAIPNETDGVSIQGASRNLVGGDDGLGNVISGNGFDGVFIVAYGADYNVVTGNLIGTDITGMVAIGRLFPGRMSTFSPASTLSPTRRLSGAMI